MNEYSLAKVQYDYYRVVYVYYSHCLLEFRHSARDTAFDIHFILLSRNFTLSTLETICNLYVECIVLRFLSVAIIKNDTIHFHHSNHI